MQEIDTRENQRASNEQECMPKKKNKIFMNVSISAIVLGTMLVGLIMLTSGCSDILDGSMLFEQKTINNSIGMEFVLIPAGEFNMGSPSDERDKDERETPLHTVTIENAYYMGKYEVTQKQWVEVMGSNPSHFKEETRPVERVSWYDAREFIKKLNELEGTDKYRLPSEAEWEYAARAGTTTRYYFGDNESDLSEYAWYYMHFFDETHPVGQKKPNPWGLYDMYGNVGEWVHDEWHKTYNGASSNTIPWIGDGESRRVLRGGGWTTVSRGCRSASRSFFEAGYRSGDIYGFRVVKVV
ncbi:MAG: formylglycine-generating enzyme family protein [Methanosarcinaceae archaeon]|nr:formylglycine-generating enzyme family protein [Methanosarcinaceae archaeon]